MMQILAKCPRCVNTLQLSLDAADKRKRCPKCFKLFKVPSLEHLEKAMRVIEATNSSVYVDQDGNIYG